MVIIDLERYIILHLSRIWSQDDHNVNECGPRMIKRQGKHKQKCVGEDEGEKEKSIVEP